MWFAHKFQNKFCNLFVMHILLSKRMTSNYLVDLVFLEGFLKGGGHKFSEFSCYK